MSILSRLLKRRAQRKLSGAQEATASANAGNGVALSALNHPKVAKLKPRRSIEPAARIVVVNGVPQATADQQAAMVIIEAQRRGWAGAWVSNADLRAILHEVCAREGQAPLPWVGRRGVGKALVRLAPRTDMRSAGKAPTAHYAIPGELLAAPIQRDPDQQIDARAPNFAQGSHLHLRSGTGS